MSLQKKISFFILSHQDDEFAARHILELELQKKNKIIVIYLSNGCTENNRISDIRNEESKLALKDLAEEIIFLGDILSIYDGHIIFNLNNIYTKLLEIISIYMNNIDCIYAPAYEGGHHDHDATNVIVSKISAHLDLIDKTFQFPIYHGRKIPFGLFKVLSAIKENGVQHQINISTLFKIRLLKSCILYKSQIRSFIGLYPALIVKLTLSTHLHIQKMNIFNSCMRPHEGSLFYEKRGRFTFKEFSEHIESFFETHKVNNGLKL